MRKPDSAMTKLPFVLANRVWHWGNFNPTQRYKRGTSQEGNLFSVSACPEAWLSIAKLGGSPLHFSDKPVILVDLLEVLEGDQYESFRSTLKQWADDKGYLEEAMLYSYSTTDEEGDEYEGRAATYDEALAEADDADSVQAIQAVIPSESLRRLHNLPGNGFLRGLQFALIEWVREHRNELDVPVAGVYWDEQYEPSALIAPRGGLFSPKELTFRPAKGCPDDEDGLAGVLTKLSLDAVKDSKYFDPQQALDRVLSDLDPEMFLGGKCHDLAVALLKASGFQGSLSACMRNTLDENGKLFGVSFSHMMFEDLDGTLWDIDGPDAADRWEERFDDIGEPDKWGMTGEFDWIDAPCDAPDFIKTKAWLKGFGAAFDDALQQRLLTLITGVEAAAVVRDRLYHGTDMASAQSIIANGIDQEMSSKGYFGTGFYCADDERLARSNYAELADGAAAIVTLTLSPEAKILDLTTEQGFDAWRDSGLDRFIGTERFDLKAVAAGVDGLRDESFRGVVIYNPKVVAAMELLELNTAYEPELDQPRI